jgi:hypothetical protein
MVTGLLALATAVTGHDFSRRRISGLFFKPAPPRGLGMSCVSPDTYSYGEVAVTSQTLTVTPKDAQGRIINDITGQPCTPLVIQAR